MTLQPTVFVVDDDPAIRRLIERLAGSVGLNVESHASAEDFLGAFDTERRGCLVLDLQLPGMSGLDLLPKARTARPDVPIVMITAYGDAATERKALEGGAEALLTKPIDFVLLRGEIETRVERGA